MRVFRGIPTNHRPVALTIGNFDGVHVGHQAMLLRLIASARERNLPATVMTFEPHPRELFAATKEQSPTRLTTLREKLELFESVGVDEVYVCHFTHAFAKTTAEQFILDLLHKRLAVRWLLVGDDFSFGAHRKGNYELLSKHANDLGFELHGMPSVEVDRERVSSTLIRDVLASGNFALAEKYLNRPYTMSGKVIHGDKIGRTIGFPTANINIKHKRPPITGIFAVKLWLSDKTSYLGAASLGTRPTITNSGIYRLEVYVLDFDGDLYDQHVKVEFFHKIRDEERYSDMESLIKQITLDVENIRQFFAEHAEITAQQNV